MIGIDLIKNFRGAFHPNLITASEYIAGKPEVFDNGLKEIDKCLKFLPKVKSATHYGNLVSIMEHGNPDKSNIFYALYARLAIPENILKSGGKVYVSKNGNSAYRFAESSQPYIFHRIELFKRAFLRSPEVDVGEFLSFSNNFTHTKTTRMSVDVINAQGNEITALCDFQPFFQKGMPEIMKQDKYTPRTKAYFLAPFSRTYFDCNPELSNRITNTALNTMNQEGKDALKHYQKTGNSDSLTGYILDEWALLNQSRFNETIENLGTECHPAVKVARDLEDNENLALFSADEVEKLKKSQAQYAAKMIKAIDDSFKNYTFENLKEYATKIGVL